MAMAALSFLPSHSSPSPPTLQNHHNFPSVKHLSTITFNPPKLSLTHLQRRRLSSTQISSGSGGDGGGGGSGDGDAGDRNRVKAILALAEIGRSLDSLSKDLSFAVDAGRIPGSIIRRCFDLEKSPVFRWLLQFGWFKTH